jgi:trehalose-phosphatase
VSRAGSASVAAVEQALPVLRASPAALISDIDGTLSPIVSRPEDATVGDDIRRALETLARLIPLVAILTAREEAVARRMVGVEGLTYVGNYALEIPGSRNPHPDFDALKSAVQPLLRDWPCIYLEEKGIAFSLHYRNCAEKVVRELLLSAISRVGDARAKVVEGKQVIEVVPAELPDKGWAFLRLLASNATEGVVYMGDDLSDVPVFRELRRRRELSGRPALGVAIADRETPASVTEYADVVLEGVGAAAEFLLELGRVLALEAVGES